MTLVKMADFLHRLSHEEFLLHGSAAQVTELEPRQARGFSEEKKQNLCAVYATPIIEIALIKATFAANTGSVSWKLNPDPFDPATPETAKPDFEVYGDVRQTSGYLYLLDRAEFEEVFPLTFAAFKRVKPLAVIDVSPDWHSVFSGIRHVPSAS